MSVPWFQCARPDWALAPREASPNITPHNSSTLLSHPSLRPSTQPHTPGRLSHRAACQFAARLSKFPRRTCPDPFHFAVERSDSLTVAHAPGDPFAGPPSPARVSHPPTPPPNTLRPPSDRAPRPPPSDTAPRPPLLSSPLHRRPPPRPRLLMSAYISHAPNPTIAASSPAAPAHSSAGSSADVAAGPAGGPAHHGNASVSPVNGGGAIKPSMPTIVSSNGTAPPDHARKSSVHIKQMPPATGPPAIKFGALSSPAPAHSTLNVQTHNPRVASPAHSPSPIPHNPLSGGKPAELPTRPNLVFGGQGPDGAEANRGPNMPPHARRESSQSAHGSFSGRPGPHYGGHPTYSPQPRTVMPNQHLGPRGVAPTFQPQNNSPFRQNRSPAITPAALHQQQQFANPQGGMPFYQPGPYPQQVRILPSLSNPSPAVEFYESVSPATASQTPSLRRYPDPFPFSNGQYAQPLTTHPNQGMYNVPPQDAYNPYYGQTFNGLQQSMHYPGPGSPGRGHHGYPQQMQAQYGHAAYGPPQAQSMSRTPSNMSQPSIPQPSTPAMTNVNHITHTPSIPSASPAPSTAAFERPKKQSKAIIIKNGKHIPFPQAVQR